MTDMLAPQHQQHRSQQEMELAAFERGRIQGEMEAARRIEAEGHMQQKQLLPDQMALQQQQATQLQRPDVVEINRLTWLQRAAFVIGEMATIAQLVLTIVWLEEYRSGVSWADGSNGGDDSFYNTHFLCASLGVFFLAQAITHYRVLPLNLNPHINRFWYVFLQAASIITFTMALVSLARSNPATESDFWSVSQWCFALGYAVFVLHALYSIVSTMLEMAHHRKAKGDYNNWSETGTHLETPEQKRDHSAYNHLARTVYAPAPHSVTRGKNLPAANANVGAQVPVAPANAPRWAETPNTHSEDYWLLPRAKWAVVGFWAIGTGFLMQLAAWQQVRATGRQSWAQDGVPLENLSPISERSREMEIVGALGFLLLLSLACMSYVAMPPRTAIVKNGVLVDPNARRSSISHNAETRLGQGHNVV